MHTIISPWPQPDVTDADVAAALDTPAKRFRQHLALHFSDHQFLRVLFQNKHMAGPDMWRTNQPSPRQLERWADMGVKTIINLRGVSPASFHILEREACARLGLHLVTFRVNSRDAPLPVMPRMARDLFAAIEYPALMHCKSGADRAGMMSVFYRHLHLGEPMEKAKEQLSAKYLHVRGGKTGILDAYCEFYLATHEGRDFITWSETAFDWDSFTKAYKSGGFSDFLVDKVLRRE